MKPDWENAPAWARWLAMDRDGLWWWYENKPSLSLSWWENTNDGKGQKAAESTPWKETLEERPDGNN